MRRKRAHGGKHHPGIPRPKPSQLRKTSPKLKINAVVLESGDHPISEDRLPPEAVWVLNRLRWAGFFAYVVGGAVRDLLLGSRPKDFDISTSATPEQIKSLFANAKIIGRRFRLVHIYFRDGDVLEVSTFRALHQDKHRNRHHSRGPLRNDNVFGTPQEDALRRDLTINGLFYDSETGQVIDYVGGLDDLDDQLVRMIGRPTERFREDPVRMIRAIRHAARTGFSIEQQTWKALRTCSREMKKASPERTLVEFLREFGGGYSATSLNLMKQSGLLTSWIPDLDEWLDLEPEVHSKATFGTLATAEWAGPDALWKLLAVMDRRIREGQRVPEEVQLAALAMPILWEGVLGFGRRKKTVHRQWKASFEQLFEPIFAPIRFWSHQRHCLWTLVQTYWKLHENADSDALFSSLQRADWVPEALLLLELECEAHGGTLTEPLQHLIEQRRESEPHETWVQG